MGSHNIAISWRLDGDGARVVLNDALLEKPEQAILQLALEQFANEGWLRWEQSCLRFSFNEWAAVGRSLDRTIGTEERDDTSAKLAALASLVPAPLNLPLQLRIRGLWGKSMSKLLLCAGGVDVDMDGDWLRGPAMVNTEIGTA